MMVVLSVGVSMCTAGGMDFNMQSAHAAILGMVFGAPLVACSAAARTDLFRGTFPVLDQLHQQQAELQKHFTAGKAPGMGCVVCALLGAAGRLPDLYAPPGARHLGGPCLM